MPESIYTGTPVDEIVLELGRGNLGQFRDFQDQTKGNFEALQLLSDNTPRLVNKALLREMIQKKITESGQPMYIDVDNNVDPGTGAAYVRKGDGGHTTARVQMIGQTLIEEGFRISAVNQASMRYNNYSMESRMQHTKAHLLAQLFTNIFVRANAQAQAWLDANADPSGGVGSVFTASGKYKQIPAAPDEFFFHSLYTEALQNQFVGRGQVFNVYASPYAYLMWKQTQAFGDSNFTNVKESLDKFSWYLSDNLQPPSPSTQHAVLYVVSGGGVGYFCVVERINDNPVETGEDRWSLITPPKMEGMKNLDLDLITMHMKEFKGYEDTSATYTGSPISSIDMIDAVSVAARFYFFKAHTPSPGTRTPINAYVKLKA